MSTAAAEPVTIPADLARFVNALFAPSDVVLLRPIETWTEQGSGRKKTRVVFGAIRYPRASRLAADSALWGELLHVAEAERANLFFGVCPRFGGEQRYDLAWQVRVVRVLWADLDSCTPDDALNRCEAAGLPRPSVIVRSGNGVHLYWLLVEPYLIDDAGPPPPVYREFHGKGKKPTPYILGPDKQKVYEFPELSPQAQHAQNVLAGIAAKVGGDHTQDLARLLRLPCTLNRKDQRNGRRPVPCELVECDPERRYTFADFEPFAEAVPEQVRAKEAAKVRLPKGKKLTANRLNKLTDFINACAVADDRSKADFALCAWAVEQGLDKEEVWAQVQDMGKFGQRGRPYFELTWGNAEAEVRQKVYDRACRKAVQRGGGGSGTNCYVNGDGNAGAGSNEADDDPFRLARLYVDDHRHGALTTLVYWQEGYHRWDGGAYRPVPDKEVRAELCGRVKREFDRLNERAVKAWEAAEGAGDEGKAVPKPVARKVTSRLIGDADQALGSLTLLPARLEPPAWLDDGEGPRPAGEILVCKNGLLHLPTKKLLPHTPRFFTPNALDYDYIGDVPPPAEWLKFLNDLWADDAECIRALQEWFGYCLLPDTSQQKILMVVGPKRSGKGTIARVLSHAVGIHNTCAPTLAGLGTNFGLWPLLGKTLAVISDARLSGRTDAAVVVERLLSISGEDAQTIDRKNKSHVTTRLPVRFLILTNELPKLNDPSGALVGRLILLQLTRSWYGREDIKLTPRLLTELPSILLWAIEGYQRLAERGHFLQPESARKLVAEMDDLSSPVGAFIRECCVTGAGCEEFVRDLYASWKSWCEEKGRKDTGTEQTFGRDLRAALPALDVRQARDGHTRVRVYVGIRLRTAGDKEEVEDEVEV